MIVKKIFLSLFALFAFSTLVGGVDKATSRNIWDSWRYHGHIGFETAYDNNVNNAPGVGGLETVKDGTCELNGQFVARKLFNQRQTLVQVSTDALFNYYFKRNSLNWNNVDVTGKIHHSLDKLNLGLRLRWSHHFQPNVLNDASELINEHFTNNFSHYEYTVNPMVTYYCGKHSYIRISDILSRYLFQDVEHRTSYTNENNDTHLLIKHNIKKIHFSLLGSYSYKHYKHLQPYYGGVNGANQQLAMDRKKKLRNLSGQFSLSYHIGHFLPTLTYAYKYQTDRFEGYDTYNNHRIALLVPSVWGAKHQFKVSLQAAYDHRKYSGRIVSTTDYTKVHYDIYEVSVAPQWYIRRNCILKGVVKYDRRNTNVHQGRLDRKYSRLDARVGVDYVF